MFKAIIIPGHPSFGHSFRELVGFPKGGAKLGRVRVISEMDSEGGVGGFLSDGGR